MELGHAFSLSEYFIIIYFSMSFKRKGTDRGMGGGVERRSLGPFYCEYSKVQVDNDAGKNEQKIIFCHIKIRRRYRRENFSRN
jgi:hypothetical protein